jgi:hypothetical protein
MQQLLVPILVGVTSLAACWLGLRVLGLDGSGLRAAVGRALEILGASVVFFVANLALGLAVIAAVRGMTSGFLSAYLLTDVSLPILSLLQGLVFGCWRGEARSRS